MISAVNLTKSFGAHTIFENVNFTIGKGERVGLVGRNGHGKTTLLRIITEEDHADSGELTYPRDYKIGYVKQHLDFTRPTVLEEGILGLPEHSADETWKVEKILFGLGFTTEDMKRDPAEFSGGYQVRLNLAKVLVSEPDMLLLDEPTNYLDVVSIRWLTRFLNQWTGELFLITHDRSFMDQVVTHILGIHRQRMRKMSGRTEKYYEQIIKEEEIHEKTRLNDEKKRKDAEQFITRFRAKARLAGLVQSRIKALDKQDQLDKLERVKSLDFAFSFAPSTGKSALHVKDLNFGYDKEMPLIQDLNFSIGRHDRICIIGKNGKGKTTLLRLLAEELTPDKGEVLAHPGTIEACYAQTNSLQLSPTSSVEEEIMKAGCERQQARDISGAMLFEGDDALKKVEILSGGEKARVLLGKVLAQPANLLLLDEPTNHLDMESCDAFIAAIDDFDGAAVIVTHNEMFLHILANRFIVFQSNGVRMFEGSYQSFLDKIGWEEEEAPSGPRKEEENKGIGKKESRKIRAEIVSRRSAEVKPLEKEISKIEHTLEDLETNQQELNEQLVAASSSGDGSLIAELSKKLHQVQTEIDSLYERYEEATILLEEKSETFDRQLAELS